MKPTALAALLLLATGCANDMEVTTDETTDEMSDETDDADAPTPPDADCPSVTISATRVVPTVQLLLDQSGSMTTAFGGGLDRWAAQEQALVGDEGVVKKLADKVVFGASLYTSSNGFAGGTCPQLRTQARATSNYVAIRDLIAANHPASDTPTGDSIDAVVADFLANPPAAGSPPIIVLATDGEPDSCEIANPSSAADVETTRNEAITAAQRAYAAGIRVFVLGVGLDVAGAHLQKVANAGVGLDPNTGTAPFYQPASTAALAGAFDAIIGGTLSCDLDIDENVSIDQAAAGVVTLDGVVLTYGTEWELADEDTFRLLGGACDRLAAAVSPTVSATFPCGSVQID